MQRPTKRSHYTPVSYLENFVGSDGALHVVLLKDGRRFEASPEAVGFENNFYRPDELDDPNVFEGKFRQFEGEASPVVKRVISDSVMPTADDDLNILYNFIAFQWARLPSTRRLITAPLKHEARIRLDICRTMSEARFREECARVRVNPDQFDFQQVHIFGVDEFDFKITTETFLQLATVMLNAMLPSIAKRRWTVIQSPKPGWGFAVSDHPVTLNWADGREVTHRNIPGHHHIGTELTIPLGSTVALVGTFEPFEYQEDAVPRYVSGINSRTYSKATRFLAASEDEFLLQHEGRILRSAELVEMLKAKQLEPKQKS